MSFYVVHKYLDEVDEAAKLCGAINTVVNLRDENGQVTGKLKGYNTDGMGYWQALTEEGIDFKGMKMVLIGTGGAATAIAVRGALDGVAEIEIFNIKDKFYSRGEEIVDLINKNTNCKATMNNLADKDLLKEKMHAADLFCDATGVGMHPLDCWVRWATACGWSTKIWPTCWFGPQRMTPPLWHWSLGAAFLIVRTRTAPWNTVGA